MSAYAETMIGIFMEQFVDSRKQTAASTVMKVIVSFSPDRKNAMDWHLCCSWACSDCSHFCFRVKAQIIDINISKPETTKQN